MDFMGGLIIGVLGTFSFSTVIVTLLIRHAKPMPEWEMYPEELLAAAD